VYIEIPPPESPWFEIARRIQNQHEELARYSSFKWRVLLWVFSSLDVFLAIAGIALGITTAVVAESSAAAARGLGAANAVVAALIALLNRGWRPACSPANRELTTAIRHWGHQHLAVDRFSGQ
jgi:hypothetical protein